MLLKALCIALSTYSIVPVPIFDWEEKPMHYAMHFLPVIGLLIALVLLFWHWLCAKLSWSPLLFAVGASVLPIIISGGIHMDGFMDTVDALASHQDRDRRLEILKDSRTGAFAVLFCMVYLLMNLGIVYELDKKGVLLPALSVYCFSRAYLPTFIAWMPKARKGGMLDSYTKKNRNERLPFSMELVTLVLFTLLFAYFPLRQIFFLGLGQILFLALVSKAFQNIFGGLTGDLAGFLLQGCELAGLFGLLLGASL